MLSIRWVKGHEYVLVGELESVLALANILESHKTKFKIYDVRGFYIAQESVGAGGFEYWIGRDSPFDA